PDIDQALLQSRIAAYTQTRGWGLSGESRLERGVLPVVVAGDFEAYWRSTGSGLAKAGMRAGLFHPMTGYSLPDAVRLASLLASTPDLSHQTLVALTHRMAAQAWDRRGFYRTLATLLFKAAEPDQRYQVLERFYRLSPDLVQRFYAADSTRTDQLRILAGRPPVPIGRAFQSLLARRFGSM
ncbi:MAG TPA: lycopene cyclase family protein, partial [Propionibacteriaceae bacterium]|nr:lycopene cyclase family protein [Propionibacteriaceae bacterium]